MDNDDDVSAADDMTYRWEPKVDGYWYVRIADGRIVGDILGTSSGVYATHGITTVGKYTTEKYARFAVENREQHEPTT